MQHSSTITKHLTLLFVEMSPSGFTHSIDRNNHTCMMGEKNSMHIADELYIGSHVINFLCMKNTWQIEICASLWSLESFNVHLIKKYYSNLHMEEIVLRWGQILPFFLFHGHMKDRGKIFQNGCSQSINPSHKIRLWWVMEPSIRLETFVFQAK